VTADKFAQVLDVAGFAQDAFDVAVAGDDVTSAGASTRLAFQQFTGATTEVADAIDAEDILYALLEIAAGQKLDDLRWRVSAELFSHLQANGGRLDAERAQASIKDNFDIDDLRFESEELGSAVFGASLVNFPRTLRSGRRPRISRPTYSPKSSHSYLKISGVN
jgi:hypothetical protein